VRQILVVEDAFVSNLLRAILQRAGHCVTCESAAEASGRLRSGNVDLLITNTPATFAEFGRTVPLLYLAAFPNPEAAADFERWLALRKPFQTTELLAQTGRLLGTV
jgi:hypothetical protein